STKVDQGRDLRRRSCQIVTMTSSALRGIEMAPRVFSRVLRQACRPRHLVRIDIQQSGFGIEGGTTPFRAAIETREDHSFFTGAQRHELPFAVETAHVFQGPAMNLG